MTVATVTELTRITTFGALENYRQWINWRPAQDPRKPGKMKKLPCDPDGVVIDPHHPANWSDYHRAMQSAYGVGFVFTERDPFVFIDLDDAWDGKHWSEMAQNIHQWFSSAAMEISAGGRGLHVIASGAHALDPSHGTGRAGLGLEIYSHSRFVALTGTAWQGDPSRDYSGVLPIVLQRYGLPLVREVAEFDPDDEGETVDARYTGPADDDALIALMLASPGSTKAQFESKAHVRDLWEANRPALVAHFGADDRADRVGFDWSSADASLMWHLSFWTGRERERMIRLFRRSKLYRVDKYEGRGAYRLPLVVKQGLRNTGVYDRPKPGTAVIVPTPAQAAAMVAAAVEPFPTVHSLQDLLATPAPPVEWVCKRLGIIRHEVGMVFATGGIGKTYLLLQLAHAAATGRLLMGMEVHRERVLFVSGEDHIGRLQRRLQAIVQAEVVPLMPPATLPPGAVPMPLIPHRPAEDVHLSVVSFAELENTELADAEGPRSRVKPTPLFETLAAVVRERQISLLMLDPTADLYGGDEIIRRQVRSFMALMRKFGCTVCIAAHPSQAGEKSGDGSSGSTGWHASARWRIYMRPDPETPEIIILENKKIQDGPPVDDFRIRMIDGRFVQAHGVTENLSRAKMVFLEILKKWTDQGRYVSNKPSVNYAPAVFERDPDSMGVKKSKFEQAMSALFDEKIIRVMEADNKVRSRRIVFVNDDHRAA